MANLLATDPSIFDFPPLFSPPPPPPLPPPPEPPVSFPFAPFSSFLIKLKAQEIKVLLHGCLCGRVLCV